MVKWHRYESNGEAKTGTYPVMLGSNLKGSKWYGGTFIGLIPQSADWYTVYNCPGAGNSAAITVDSPMEVIGLTIDGVWDGFRPRAVATIRDSYITKVRDDGVEADSGNSLTVENVLFDHVFVGISSTPNSYNANNRILIQNTTIYLGNYLRKGQIEPGSFIKGTSNTSPIEIHDSTFAFSMTGSILNNRMKVMWPKVKSCSNNLLLWLSDSSLPSSFPRPPACFRVVTGAEARAILAEKRATFLNSFDY